MDASVIRDLVAVLGREDVLTESTELRTCECDGLTGYRVVPALVALPRSAAEVAATVAVCARHGIPFVARGAGPGLSGGTLPVADGVVISLQRLRRVLDVDPVNRRAVVEPGVTNRDISRAAAPYGLYYAPDPCQPESWSGCCPGPRPSRRWWPADFSAVAAAGRR
ncbi:FAD-binding protein [Streptomyces sp. NPDC056948]|uniref:FAD-binding protein n=1 Tax=Streptomyces sp. NPDC056948 TaxID=3345975 RepID=UPI00363186C9